MVSLDMFPGIPAQASHHQQEVDRLTKIVLDWLVEGGKGELEIPFGGIGDKALENFIRSLESKGFWTRAEGYRESELGRMPRKVFVRKQR